MSIKARLIIFGVIAVVALGVGAFFGIRHMMREAELGKFKPIAQSYAQTPPEQEGGEAYLVGKVLPVNVADHSPDHLYFDIPDGLRASRPEEVGTVVLLLWGKEQVGTYEGGGGAYQQTCDVVLVNHKTKKTMHSQRFLGSFPPQTTTSNSATA